MHQQTCGNKISRRSRPQAGNLKSLRDQRHTLSNRGTSLIEVIVTMSVASTLFLLATAWIHQSFFIASKMRDQSRHHDSLMRLSRQFRDDVHSAESIETLDDSNVQIEMPTSVVRYQFDSEGITRSAHQDGQEKPIAEEEFQLLKGADVSCKLDDEWVALVVTRTLGHLANPKSLPTSNGLRRPSDLHVRARIGLWLDDQSLAGEIE